MYKILFELTQEYYLPSFLSIYQEMQKDQAFDVYFRVGPNQKKYFGIISFKQKKRIENQLKKQGCQITDECENFDAVICGTTLKKPVKYGEALLCNVDHGPGLKTLRYREFLKQKNTKYHIFVEGRYRIEKFQKYGLHRHHEIFDVGLPKLDPFFRGEFHREKILSGLNLDKNKKTVLYAPSYKPTSIPQIIKTLPQLLENYNVIVKLHPYSWNGKYAPHWQHRIFEKLQKKHRTFHLVPKENHNMMPYLYAADTMISDGSSVINEFLALGRCGVIFDLDYSSMRHSDGQPILENDTKHWLSESFVHIDHEDQLQEAVQQALTPSDARAEKLIRDRDYVFSYVDGHSGERVKDKIKEILDNK